MSLPARLNTPRSTVPGLRKVSPRSALSSPGRGKSTPRSCSPSKQSPRRVVTGFEYESYESYAMTAQRLSDTANKLHDKICASVATITRHDEKLTAMQDVCKKWKP